MSDNVRLDSPSSIPAAPAPTPNPVNRGQSTTVHADGTVIDHQVRHASINENGVSGGTVSSTLSRFGSHSVEMQPGNPQSRTSVENAERMGLIRRDGAGGWMDAAAPAVVHQQAPGPQEQPAPQVDPNTDPNAGVYLPAEDAVLLEALGPMGQQSFDAALAGTLAAVVNDHDFGKVADELARREGLEPSKALELINQSLLSMRTH